MRGKISKFTRCVLIFLITALILSSDYQLYASSVDLKTYPAPGRLIDMGSHRLHIYCIGQGEPAVVMEADISGWSTDWILVQPAIAKVTRVCT